MLHRYFTVRVYSDYGDNRYRLIGLAKPEDKTADITPGKWPAHLVLTTENESEWLPVVELSVSPISGRLSVNCKLTVEQ